MDMYSPKTPEMFMKYYQIHACTHIYFLITIIKKGAERRGVGQEEGHHTYYVTSSYILGAERRGVGQEDGHLLLRHMCMMM